MGEVMGLLLDRMSTEDKLRAMEELWADLSRTPSQIPSPGWHAEVLAERKARIEEGETDITEWSAARQRLRERTP